MPPKPKATGNAAQIVNQALAYIGHKIDELIAAVKGFKQEVKVQVDGDKIGAAIAKALSETSIKGDHTDLIEALSGASAAFAKSDNTQMVATLNALKEHLAGGDPMTGEHARGMIAVMEQHAQFQQQLPEILTTALEAIAKAATEVRTVKLDDMQMRQLAVARGGSSGGGSFSALAGRTATKITQTNLSLALANTEYSYKFPPNTVKWVIKLRDQGYLFYYSFTSGKLPTSGDGSLYSSVPQNFLRSEDGIEWSNKTIYLGAETDAMIAEIEVYTLA